MDIKPHRLRRILQRLGIGLVCLMPLLAFDSPSQAADVNSDFALELKVNGQDMLAAQAFTINPDESLKFDMTIHDVHTPVEMQRLSIEIFFAGIPVSTITQELDAVINPGEIYSPDIAPVSARDYLSIWGVNVTTGKYKAVIKLEYKSLGSPKTWTQTREVEVPGNPMATVAGVATAIITGVALVGVAALLKSLAGYSLETQALSGSKSLESQARSKVSSALVSAVKKVLVKDRCPVCEGVIKHGFCPNCRKSARELQRLYRRRIHDLAGAGMKLLEGGEVKSMADIPEKLGISGALAEAVRATMQNARLFEVKRVTRSLMVSALITGASSAVASLLWVTIGGLAVLNTAVLMGVLLLSVLLPLIIAGALNLRMRRRYTHSLLAPPDNAPATEPPR